MGHNSENKHQYNHAKKTKQKGLLRLPPGDKEKRWDGKGGGGGRRRKRLKERKKFKNKSHTDSSDWRKYFFFIFSFFFFLSGVSDSVTADINFDVGTCSRQRLDGGYGWIINISTPKPSSQMIFAHLVCRATGLRVFKYIVSLGTFLGAGLWEVCVCGEYASSTLWPRPSSGRHLGIWV